MKTTKQIEKELTGTQKEAARLLVERNMNGKSMLTYEDIAETVGISVRTLRNWRMFNESFNEYQQAITRNILREAQAKMVSVLMKNLDATQPSVKMLDIQAKMTQDAYPTTKQEVSLEVENTLSIDSINERIAKLKAGKSEVADGE